MTTQHVDIRRSYELIFDKITTLALAPSAPINEPALAAELNLPLAAVQEALELLAQEHLVRITPRHGLYVAEINTRDLERISELRVPLEGLAAGFAAERRTPDDMIVLESLRQEQVAAAAGDPRRLFALDQRIHQAIAAAAHNDYLAETLGHFFGLSLRFWSLLLPAGGAVGTLDALPGAVEKHLALIDAIRARDAEAAEVIMCAHVESFYRAVRPAVEARYPSPAGGPAAGGR